MEATGGGNQRKIAYPTPKPGESPGGAWVENTPCRYCWQPERGALLGAEGARLAPIYATTPGATAFRARGFVPSAGCWGKAGVCEWVVGNASAAAARERTTRRR